MDSFRRAFSVLWVVERSPSQPRPADVTEPYHRRRHPLRNSAVDCLRVIWPPPYT